MIPVLILALLPLIASPASSPATQPSLTELLDRMTEAQERIDTFEADVKSVTRMYFRDDESTGQRTWLPETPAPAPYVTDSCEYVVSGERYRSRVRRELAASAPIVTWSAWDGKEFLVFVEGGHVAYRDNKPHRSEGDLGEPRQLAYRDTLSRSRLTELRAALQAGKLTLSNTTLDGHEVLRLESRLGGPDEKNTYNYVIWVDPRAGYLPRQVEEYIYFNGERVLLYRFTHIQGRQVAHGVWFPVSGDLEQIEYQRAADRGRVRSREHLRVNEKTLSLRPDTQPENMKLDLPPNMTLRDPQTGKKVR